MDLRSKILTFSLTIGGIALMLAGMTAGTVYLIAQDRERLERVRMLDVAIRDTESLATEIMLDGGERPFQQWKLLASLLSAHIEGLQGIPSVSSGVVAELHSRVDAIDSAFERMAEIGVTIEPLARSILAARVRTNKGALISRVASIEARVHELQEENFSLVLAANLTILSSLLLLGLGHQAVLRRFATSALSDLISAIERLEDGDLERPIESRRKDEIGRVLLALDNMREQLNERIQAEDAARQQAEELSAAKTKFIASVSHELRTPLMGLLGMTDLAMRRDDIASIKRDLGTAQNAGNHLLDLVNQILDFSKIEAGKMELADEAFSADLLVETARSVFAVQASQKGIQLDLVKPRGNAPLLLGDPQRLSQILFNLVGNAVKFTDQGAVSIRYVVEALSETRHRLRVDVVDTGPGIPDEKQAEIFEEFAQVGERSVAGKVGTGLGLTISSRLIALMGGEIGLVPTRRGGAHFYFAVELDQASKQDVETADVAQKPTTGTLRPCRVLVVEDVDVNRMIVSEYLIAEGHTVAEAVNGAECLERLRNESFDVILMDVNMPVMNGLEATRAIRTSKQDWCSIPIVGLTANAFSEQVSEYLAAGMDGCISKPVVPAELRAAMAKVTIDQGNGIAQQDAATTEIDPPLEELPLVDETKLQELQRLMGSEKLGILLERSSDVLSQEIAVVEDSAASSDAVEQALHKLKGTAANIGYKRLAMFAERASELTPAAAHEEACSADLADIALRSEAAAIAMLEGLGRA